MHNHKPLFAFFGTSRLSVCVLDALEAHGFVPALIITAPDKPQGRGLDALPCPAALWAKERDIEVIKPSTLKDESLVAELKNTDWDLFIVAMYAKIIPRAVLDIPRLGCLNVHPSLLPRFSGPSPVLSAILADERTTGVCVMEMVEELDAGPVVAQARIELEPEDWPPRGSVFEELLATEGGNLLAEIMPEWINGATTSVPQNESEATFTKKFTDVDALIEFDPVCPPKGVAARATLLHIRAFDKSPRAYFMLINSNPEKQKECAKRIIITDAIIEDDTLKILSIIPEGKREMPYQDFMRQFRK